MPFASLKDFRGQVLNSLPPLDSGSDPFVHFDAIFAGLLKYEPVVMSCVLFVRDPITEQLRHVCNRGVAFEEPLDGFMLTLEEEENLRRTTSEPTSEQKEYKYFSSPKEAKLVGRKKIEKIVQDHINRLVETKSKIYGNFVQREGVESCLRFEHVDPKTSRISAVLFVNFRRQVDLKKQTVLKKVLDVVFSDVIDGLAAIAEKLTQDHSKALRQIAQILRPIRALVGFDVSSNATPMTQDKRLSEFFRRLLLSAMAALNVEPKRSFGTIHLFRKESRDGDLKICAKTVDMDTLEPILHAYKGEGVISWVALNRRPLLCKQRTSKDNAFNKIANNHSQFKEVESQIVVPMLVGSELIGVINIESLTPAAFTSQDVHTLWYAANEAALAWKLWNNAQEQNRLARRAQEAKKQLHSLLDIVTQAVNLQARDDSLFDKMAIFIKDATDVDLAEIWLFDSECRTFSFKGGSYTAFDRETPLRPEGKGISAVIFSKKVSLWISSIDLNSGEYEAESWDEGNWIPVVADDASPLLPNSVSEVAMRDKVTCELGIPILRHTECVGVAWLKYTRNNVQKPSIDKMESIIKLGSQIACVTDMIIQAEKREERQVQSEIERQYFASGDLQRRGMTGYVLCSPQGRLGGDFCVPTSDGGNSWGVLIGDMMGHGYEAALRMLPLIMAFRIYQRDSTSPKYLIEQLAAEAERTKITLATALCFVCFEKPFKEGGRSTIRRFVSSSSAGHPPLIVVRADRMKIEELPARNGHAFTNQLGSLDDPFGDACIEVFPGDLLIGHTDGIDDAGIINRSSLFGEKGIVKAIPENGGPESIARSIKAAATGFAGGALHDDATILVIRIDSLPELPTQKTS